MDLRPKHRTRMSRGRRWLLAAILILPVVAAVALGAAWSANRPAPDRTPPNVELGGAPVGDFTAAQLTAAVNDLAATYASATIEIRSGDEAFTTSTQAIDLEVMVEATVADTLLLDDRGPVIRRVLDWARSFIAPLKAPVRISFDEDAVRRVVAERDPGRRRDPREPNLRAVDGELEVVPGRPGIGMNSSEVIENLPAAAQDGTPLVVRTRRRPISPRYSDEDAMELIAGAHALVADLEIRSAGQTATVRAADVRTWIRAEAADNGLTLRIDHRLALETVRGLLDQADPEPQDATYDVVDGVLTIVPGVPGRGCCAEVAGGVLETDLLNSRPQPIDLPSTSIPPQVTEEDLQEDDIRELVSTFTTHHAPGQPRVKNIHLMADLVRGQFVEPGGTFSINEFVGRRTAERGFVSDGVIQDGKFTTGVGGGVSQFATTLFNAAFFAGLDFVEYQSHSLYISRYPYGREATLSFPKPDLKISNPSPYPILIWPTYTDSSITVSMYSTKWVEVEQTDQSSIPRGPCRLVRTERTRNYLADNTSETDRVIAVYRPAEGVNCT